MTKTIFVFAIALASLSAYAGTDVGRGGDAVALEFKSTALYDLQLIRNNPSIFGVSIDVTHLERVIVGTQLETQDKVFLGGVEKDAVNYPNPDRIVISSSRWLKLSSTDPRKDALVIHEYLALVGVDDTKYEYSSKVLEILRKQETLNGRIPRYSCWLIKDPNMAPQYLDSVSFGGQERSAIAHLGAEKIRVQIYVGNGGHGTDVLITFSDGDNNRGGLELPGVRDFPSNINLDAKGRNDMHWRVSCSR